MTKKLVRFRADLTKVRVSIMRAPSGDQWIVSVRSRSNPGCCAVRVRSDPKKALHAALQDAAVAFEEDKEKGLDLDMQWAYEHPFLEQEENIPPYGPRYVASH